MRLPCLRAGFPLSRLFPGVRLVHNVNPGVPNELGQSESSLAGRRLGGYQLLSLLGVGGMGEVYRARDLKLGREVAVKVLPRALAADVGRRQRLEREARALAALNHSHIATIHGFEEADGVPALILELVEGPTLADRLAGGPLPPAEAIRLAAQMADALAAAHARGILHRDLKPANIKVTPAGLVKVLDFGLAKALAPASEAYDPVASTVIDMTEEGKVVGTAGYMSPEQARGQAVDRRTDVWALGCVLYEMLTGRRAFAGEGLADTLAAVLHQEPAWDALPAGVPPVLERFLRRCLEKDPARRLRDAGDLCLALEGAFEPAEVATPKPPGRAVLLAAAGIVFLGGIAALFFGRGQPAEPREVVRFSQMLPDHQTFTRQTQPMVAVSPDGSVLVYVANHQLHRRPLQALEATPIAGTTGDPSTPFFSPDGRSVGYWDARVQQLRTIALDGGVPVVVTHATNVAGAHWERDGTIVYGQWDAAVWRVPAAGGEPELLLRTRPGELVYGPRMLPDGRSVLFSVVEGNQLMGQSTAWDAAWVVAASLKTGERKQLVRGSDARLTPTGHLVYALDTTLFAVPFDLKRREVTGGPVPVVTGVQRTTRGDGGAGGGAHYDFSHQGTLVQVAASQHAFRSPTSLVAVDRQGNATPLLDERHAFWRPRISPDGRRVAVEVLDTGLAQIWIVDLERRTVLPLTFDGENDYPVWTPDGRHVLYDGSPRGVRGIHRQRADGSGEAELLLNARQPWDVSQNGTLLFPRDGGIWTLDLETLEVAEFLNTPALERMARFSPDGKWVAYVSNETKETEVYVRPFPPVPGIGRRVSLDGGLEPAWAADGSALYYRSAAGDLMMAPVTLSPAFTVGRPVPLFRYEGVFRRSGTATAYDPHPEGDRFIMVAESETPFLPVLRRIDVTLNWFEQLRRLTPP
jgi:eukaryotic-like serine/threonine-protein kinase